MTIVGARHVLVASAILASTVAAAASRPITLELKLPAKPVAPRPEIAAALTKGPLSIVVTDARHATDPAIVGAQRAKGSDLYVWRAKQPVAPAVAGFVTLMLEGWSMRVSPGADLGLTLELTRYEVTERSETFGSTYIADVRIKAALSDRAGTVLWTGETAGDAKRPGVDGRASMCNEALSIALRGALAKVLSSVTLVTAAPTLIEPGALLADLLRLKAGGVAEDVLVSYVEQRKLSRPLTVDEILQWKDAGIPDAAIKAATRP
jgi:hypothetical protein